MHEQIRQSIKYPAYQELTSEEYKTLILMGLLRSDDPLFLSLAEFTRLRSLGFVRRGVSLRDHPNPASVCAVLTDDGRDAAFLYFQQMLVAIDGLVSEVKANP